MQHRDSTADGLHDDGLAASDEILQQKNKRLTLNLLIQGAGMHTFLTTHHIVKDELEAIRPGLSRCYDAMGVSLALNYFIGDIVLVYGLPSWFWSRVHRPSHPFHQHRLLATHGRELWLASKRYLLERGWKKRIVCVPGIHYLQMFLWVARVAWIERGKKPRLARLAEYANSLIWGIDQNRLAAELTTKVAFGHLQMPKTVAEGLTRAGAVGYGGVERRNGQFKVVAKAWNWPLVSHELGKGTVELIFLHGLNSLDDETYRIVTEYADRLQYETWMLQAGAEIWRRLLAVMPDDHILSETLMHIARLDPEPLERLMMAVIDDPAHAQALLEKLG